MIRINLIKVARRARERARAETRAKLIAIVMMVVLFVPLSITTWNIMTGRWPTFTLPSVVRDIVPSIDTLLQAGMYVAIASAIGIIALIVHWRLKVRRADRARRAAMQAITARVRREAGHGPEQPVSVTTGNHWKRILLFIGLTIGALAGLALIGLLVSYSRQWLSSVLAFGKYSLVGGLIVAAVILLIVAIKNQSVRRQIGRLIRWARGVTVSNPSSVMWGFVVLAIVLFALGLARDWRPVAIISALVAFRLIRVNGFMEAGKKLNFWRICGPVTSTLWLLLGFIFAAAAR